MNYGYKIHRFEDLEGVRSILRFAYKRMVENEQDNCYLITGVEGKGKSTLELWMMQIWYEEFLKKPCPGEFITDDLPPFIRALRAAQEGDGIALDEGGELASTNTFDTMVKDMVKAFKVMRAKKFMTLICFTNPMHINRYWREDRVRGVFYIPRVGTAYYYPKEFYIKKVLNMVGKGDQSKSIEMLKAIPAPLQFKFPKYKGKLLELYKQNKMENIDNVLSDLDVKYGAGVKPYTMTAAARKVGLSLPTMIEYVKAGRCKGFEIKLPTGKIRYHIYPDDLKAFMDAGVITSTPLGISNPPTTMQKPKVKGVDLK